MTTYKIYQLERLGKKQKRWTIRKIEKHDTISISSKVYGPTTLENCERKLTNLKKD